MRQKLLIALGLVVALLVLFVIVVAIQPSEFRYARATTIAAPPETVFAQVNDFHKWEHWSPWAKLDPNMKTTYEGPSSGKGAKYAWLGNSDVGEGKMEITESRSPEYIKIRLDFIQPFAATNWTEFKFEPNGDQTHVEWSMSGENAFVAKAMCMFMDMDAMMGEYFEKGLAQMKKVAEEEAKSATADAPPQNDEPATTETKDTAGEPEPAP